MFRAEVREIHCKSVLNPVKGMPFRWSANPYRGCSHACVYCYARVTHTYLDLGAGEDFQRILFAKVNAPEVLRRELSRPGWRREWVAVGTSTDPYQPIEGTYRLTRGMLAAMVDHRTPGSITTKSTLVVRDTDLLQELTRVAGAAVYFSIATLDEEVWRKTEPGTPSPRQRLRAVEMLARAGVRVEVLLAPIIPGLSDTTASMRAVMEAARAAGAAGVHPLVLRLDPEVKEYFQESMQNLYPALVRGYAWLYRRTYAPRAYLRQVERRAAALLIRAGLTGTGPMAATGSEGGAPGQEAGAADHPVPAGTQPRQLTLPL